MGGTAAVATLIGMVSAKASAVFLGAAGVGEVRLYQNLGGLFGALTGLGIGTSAVRALASAEGVGDLKERAAIDVALRRLCWLMGIGGWALMAALAWPLSEKFFSGAIEPWAVAVFGITVLFSQLGNGLGAVVQSRREIVAIAKANLASSACVAGIAVACYWLLGREGILPALVAGGMAQLIVSIILRRRVLANPADRHAVPEQPWRETARIARLLIMPGTAFMAGSLLPMVTNSIITALIIGQEGLAANGLYWAAWSLSGLFASFITSAMSTDYLPRLSAASHDPVRSTSLANEQIEIGLLLGTPGVVAMMVLSPVALSLFYSPQFLEATDLIVILGAAIAVQLGNWPVGYLVLAQGRSPLVFTLIVAWQCIHITAAWLGLTLFGLVGAALGFLIFNIAAEIVMCTTVHRIIGFRWSTRALQVMGFSWITCALAAISTRFTNEWQGVAGFAIIALAACVAVRGLVQRLGTHHRIVARARSAPVLRLVVAVATIGSGQQDHASKHGN